MVRGRTIGGSRVAERFDVRMSDVKVAPNPAILAARALGSCVAIALYDGVAKVGGLAHIMLPDSHQVRVRWSEGRFADTAVKAMLTQLADLGATRRRITAKIVGGANMFPSLSPSGHFNIGERNVAAVKRELEAEGIRLVAEDTGDSYGRSVEFFTETGKVKVTTIAHGSKEL